MPAGVTGDSVSAPSIFGSNRWFFTVQNPDNRAGVTTAMRRCCSSTTMPCTGSMLLGPNAGKPNRYPICFGSEHCWELDPEQLVSQLDQAQIKLLVKENGQCGGWIINTGWSNLGMSGNDASPSISNSSTQGIPQCPGRAGQVSVLSHWTSSSTTTNSAIHGCWSAVPAAVTMRGFRPGVAGRYDLVDAELTNKYPCHPGI